MNALIPAVFFNDLRAAGLSRILVGINVGQRCCVSVRGRCDEQVLRLALDVGRRPSGVGLCMQAGAGGWEASRALRRGRALRPGFLSPLRFAEDDALGLEKVLTEIEFDVISDQVLTAKGNRTSPLDPRIQQGSRLQFTLDDAGHLPQGGSTRHERRASENKPPRTGRSARTR